MAMYNYKSFRVVLVLQTTYTFMYRKNTGAALYLQTDVEIGAVASNMKRSRDASHLVVHLDVNGTILCEDPAGSKTVETMINDIVADNAWGQVVEEPEGSGKYTWRCTYDELREEPEEEWDPDAVKYKWFVENILLPFPERKDKSKEEHIDTIKKVKRSRTALTAVFTQEGQPGRRFSSLVGDLINSLEYEDGTGAKHRYYVLPAFFELVLFLCRTVGKDKFTIVLRTFGTDLPDVLQHWDDWVSSKHPRYPEVNCDLQTVRSVSIHPEVFSCFYRHEKLGVCQIIGTTEKPPPSISTLAELRSWASTKGCSKVLTSSAEVYSHLSEMVPTHNIVGWRDYFEYWSAHNQGKHAGKAFIVSPRNRRNRESDDIVQIFLDDNVREYDDFEQNIVDVRDVTDKQIKPSTAAKAGLIHRVSTLGVLQDPNYFVDLLKRLPSTKALFQGKS